MSTQCSVQTQNCHKDAPTFPFLQHLTEVTRMLHGNRANSPKSFCQSEDVNNVIDDFLQLQDADYSSLEPICNDLKKRKVVTFADAYGKELACIRMITEGRDTPPLLSPIFMALMASNTTGVQQQIAEVRYDFSQPISNYSLFRERLNLHYIALESVCVTDSVMVAIVKVRNIGYHKSVFVRITQDDWNTCEDLPCSYIPEGGAFTETAVDGFSSRYELPVKTSACVQFAVFFRCNGMEFWDNNDGKNFRILISIPDTTLTG